MAIVAQAAVLALEALFTYHWGFVTVGSRKYGFPLTCAGTVAFSLEIFCCAHVIQSSTKKVSYETTDEGKSLKLLWLQKGSNHQGICHSGIAIKRHPVAQYPNDVIDPIWVSKRVDNKYTEYWMIVGVILDIGGWLLQAEGLRWMHWTASILQLGLRVAMILFRAWLRRNLNANPKITQMHDGHEVDWLSMEIGKADGWEVCRLGAIETDESSNGGQKYHEHRRKYTSPRVSLMR